MPFPATTPLFDGQSAPPDRLGEFKVALQERIATSAGQIARETAKLIGGLLRQFLRSAHVPREGLLLPRLGDVPLPRLTIDRREIVTGDFGQLRIGTGRAFRSDDPDSEAVTVGKRWMTSQNRDFLIEAVEVKNAAQLFKNLPPKPGGASLRPKRGIRNVNRAISSAQALPIIRPTKDRSQMVAARRESIPKTIRIRISLTGIVRHSGHPPNFLSDCEASVHCQLVEIAERPTHLSLTLRRQAGQFRGTFPHGFLLGGR